MYGEGDTGAIEFCWGACEGLVSGIISSDEALFLRQNGELISKRLGRKEHVVKHAEFAVGRSNVVKTRATERQRSQFALSDHDIRRLISLSIEIEDIFRKPQDIEAVFSTSGELVITQARSIHCPSETGLDGSESTYSESLPTRDTIRQQYICKHKEKLCLLSTI